MGAGGLRRAGDDGGQVIGRGVDHREAARERLSQCRGVVDRQGLGRGHGPRVEGGQGLGVLVDDQHLVGARKQAGDGGADLAGSDDGDLAHGRVPRVMWRRG